MKPVLLVDAVGLTPRWIGPNTPHLTELARSGASSPMSTVLPAVTCSAQATMLTGKSPSAHGAVGNGWFARDTGDVALWRQSNALVTGEKLYETARRVDPTFTCAKIFWWWNLGAAVDWSVTPRPCYPADGRKIPAIYGAPSEYATELERELGVFPFFDFWGPKSGIRSSRWLADAAIHTLATKKPSLTMVYLPHLDYDFQRFGPDDARATRAVEQLDALVGDLRKAASVAGAEIVIVSEYGITAVERPVHVNLALRKAGLLAARPTPAGDVLDVFASAAFAVSDHQLAHVYCKDSRSIERALEVLKALPGVDHIYGKSALRDIGLDHPRSGDLVLVAERDAWFTYYYWIDGIGEPDFARTVDIHRKPGYDPCELFVDPAIPVPQFRVAQRLLQKKLGFRYLMDVIPLNATLVRGSHGRLPDDVRDGPIFMSSRSFADSGGEPTNGIVDMHSVPQRVLTLLGRAR